MRQRIGVLAHDSLRGRDTPSPGLDAAAAYLAREYQRLGLEPAGDDGTFIQRYPLPTRVLDTASVRLAAVVNGQNRELKYGADFYAAPAAPRPGVEMAHSTLVFFGELPERGLPAQPDLPGKVMVVDLPGDYDREWRIAAGRAQSAAEAAGATALFVILDAAFPPATLERQAAAAAQPRTGLVNPAEIPVFYLSREAAARYLDWGGFDLASAPRSVPGGLPVELNAHFAANARTTRDGRPPNVVALLPGSDPALANEYVILSAHMDHVGVGRPVNGDSIYNGADDDASGTSALVEVAEALATLPERPRRPVLFVHVSGEEKGLLGSEWFANNPTVPLANAAANLNADMIGRNSPDTVVVIGKDYSSLGATVAQVAAAHPEIGLEVVDDQWPEERFFFRSDHFNFAKKEIPALFFFAGTHEDYHRPSDHVEDIDADKAARVARMIYYVTRSIADAAERPVWDPAGLAEVRALTR